MLISNRSIVISFLDDFVDCGVNLAKALRYNLPSIFDQKLDRNFHTIWVTLGYFKHKDFFCNKDKKFEIVFNKFRHIELSVKINELRLVKYTKRSLEDPQIFA